MLLDKMTFPSIGPAGSLRTLPKNRLGPGVILPLRKRQSCQIVLRSAVTSERSIETPPSFAAITLCARRTLDSIVMRIAPELVEWWELPTNTLRSEEHTSELQSRFGI